MKNDSQQRRSVILNVKLIHDFYEFYQNFKFKPLHNIINICDIVRLTFYLINLMKTYEESTTKFSDSFIHK